MIRAVIDLGTNTFNLCIAKVSSNHIEILHSEKEGVALGLKGINDQTIHKEAISRATTTLRHFKDVCERFNVETIQAIGTSAIRDALNREELIDKIQREIGIKIDVISGTKEAELIHKGVSWTFSFENKAVIMDIGGGSTEFILADQSGILDLCSLDIGLSRLIQSRNFQDPLSLDDIKYVHNWFSSKADVALHNFKATILIGASGSFETFYEMMYSKTFPTNHQAIELDVEQVKDICNLLIGSTQQERETHPFIIPIRRKMAPFAAIKTLWIIDYLGITTVFVSPCALKEGALLNK
jgi:exopolyphosphatase / guanosine-5'-triphosphate,3'-diphosphate pyrophosphatase